MAVHAEPYDFEFDPRTAALGYLLMAATFAVVSWRTGQVSIAGRQPLAAEKVGGE